jgi:hypothetical protein
MYRLTTLINGSPVTVECDEQTARILLPLWAAAEPNLTECRDLADNRCIVAWLDEAIEPLTRPEEARTGVISRMRPFDHRWQNWLETFLATASLDEVRRAYHDARVPRYHVAKRVQREFGLTFEEANALVIW